MGSYKIIYSWLSAAWCPSGQPQDCGPTDEPLHARAVRGLTVQFVPDGPISFEPLLIHLHQSLRLFWVEDGEAFQGRNLTENLVCGHEGR